MSVKPSCAAALFVQPQKNQDNLRKKDMSGCPREVSKKPCPWESVFNGNMNHFSPLGVNLF
jgi:hypothetical protein